MDKPMDTYYYVVYREVILQICAGIYKKGDTLPSLREMCDIYGVGRNTVRSALQMLQEHGYIKMEPRKQAIVSFDIENPQYKKGYIAETVKRKQAILQVYDFMELALPEIFIYILKSLPRTLRIEIAGLIGFFAENLSVKNEVKTNASVMQLYRLVISLTNNHLLEQLFTALVSYVQIPISISDWDKLKYKAVVPLYKTTFRKCQKLLVAQEYDKLGKQISLFCQTTRKGTERYLGKFEKRFRIVEKENAYGFKWSVTGRPDYIQLASALILKIGKGEYKTGDILPSYALLAQENGVSEITSRNAIEILGKLELVSTVNGVGSKVKGFSIAGREIFLKDLEMRRRMVSYFEAMQLLIILCRPVMHRAEEMMTENEQADLKNRFLTQGLTSCFETMLNYDSLPVASSVFACLKNELAWGYFLNFEIEEDVAISKQLAEQESSIVEWVYAGCQGYYQNARKIARDNSIEIPLSIFQCL